MRELVEHHVSGQLKVAPEHCSLRVLRCMGKPSIDVYERFAAKFTRMTKKLGKEQYLVPYLMSSHPGSKMEDAVALAVFLKKNKLRPEQVQDFYPTPGTASTAMFSQKPRRKTPPARPLAVLPARTQNTLAANTA
jgi:radical SAM superfamily enzyme YgiQ (UPF0313 family)